MALLTFILTTPHPTTYQRNDGTYFEYPVTKRIVPEYSKLDEKGKSTLCRHIRNENTIVASEQTSTFNPLSDNIFFTNGVCILDEEKDRITVEFLRNHPMNADTPSYSRRSGVVTSFREVMYEVEGLSEIDKIQLVHSATSMIMALKSEKDGKVVYSEKLNFLANLFQLDGSLAPSQQIVELVRKGSQNPTDFLRLVSTKEEDFEKTLQSAIDYDVVKIDENSAFFKGNAVYTTDNGDAKAGFKYYLLSTKGEDLKNDITKAVEQKRKKVKDEMGKTESVVPKK